MPIFTVIFPYYLLLLLNDTMTMLMFLLWCVLFLIEKCPTKWGCLVSHEPFLHAQLWTKKNFTTAHLCLVKSTMPPLLLAATMVNDTDLYT